MGTCKSNEDDLCYCPFDESRLSFRYGSSDDDLSFSTMHCSLPHGDCHFDFESEHLESFSRESDSNSRKNDTSDSSSSSSSESDNSGSVWSTSTMTKFCNGNRWEIMRGYEYWYYNDRYHPRQPLQWLKHEAEKMMNAAQFLDNPRLEFLIVQKCLRNAQNNIELSLSVLAHLNEAYLLKRVVIHDCVENALHEKPSRLEEIFRFLIELDPRVLKERPFFRTFLLHCYRIRGDCRESYWQRFLTLFEVSLFHYPREMGFLFHRDFKCSLSDVLSLPILSKFDSPFEMACVVFGRERVANAVDKIVARTSRRTCTSWGLLVLSSEASATMSVWVLAAATNPKIALDALYFLVRRDPTMFRGLDGEAEEVTSKIKKK